MLKDCSCSFPHRQHPQEHPFQNSNAEPHNAGYDQLNSAVMTFSEVEPQPVCSLSAVESSDSLATWRLKPLLICIQRTTPIEEARKIPQILYRVLF